MGGICPSPLMSCMYCTFDVLYMRGLDAKRIIRQNEKNDLRSVLEWYPTANDVGEMFSSLTPVN